MIRRVKSLNTTASYCKIFISIKKGMHLILWISHDFQLWTFRKKYNSTTLEVNLTIINWLKLLQRRDSIKTNRIFFNHFESTRRLLFLKNIFFQIGTVAGNFLSGLILHSYSWPWVFYFFGGISIVWFIIFVSFWLVIHETKFRLEFRLIESLFLCSQTIICYSNPGSHPFISKEERQYLESELGQLKRTKNLPPTPWYVNNYNRNKIMI